MAYSEFHTCRSDAWPTSPGTVLLDTDGATLYETDYRALLLKIIKRNDIPRLNQYISVYSRAAALAPGEVYYYDPFWVAAAHGSTDALRVLLEQYTAAPTQTTALDQRGFTLLNAACGSASVETVRFLLDSQPPLGTVSARDRYDETPLLSAAASLVCLKFEDADESADSYGWIRDRIARGEELMNLLLDRGASAQDAVLSVQRDGDDGQQQQQQPLDTVLGLAVSRASYALVKRLIDEGADANTKQQHTHKPVGAGGFGRKKTSPWDVTALHLGSLFWNAEGVKALLDHHADNSTIGHDITDLVSSRDSNGRLPLHWAAAGPGPRECTLPDDEISSRLIDTFKLLLAGNPSAINVQDEEGATPLHYVIGSHAACGGSKHADLAIRFLLEHGADASVSDSNGQTVLHIFAYCSVDGGPIDTALLDLLVAHGANVNHADKDGNTAFHIMARNLRQVQAVKFLLGRGADVRATNAKGDTAFHEAARGILRPRETRDKKIEEVTVADQIRAQDEMMGVLQEASGGDSMMNQPNAAGRTPRQLRSETRSRWQGMEEPRRRGAPAARGCSRVLGTRG